MREIPFPDWWTDEDGEKPVSLQFYPRRKSTREPVPVTSEACATCRICDRWTSDDGLVGKCRMFALGNDNLGTTRWCTCHFFIPRREYTR